jgi:hypothetical protein
MHSTYTSVPHILRLATLTTLLGTVSALAQHGHLNVGVADTNNNGIADPGDRVAVKNANDFAYDFVAGSGYTGLMDAVSAGAAAAYYGGSAYTYTVTPTAIAGNSGRQAQSINTTTRAVTYRAWETFAPTANGSLAVAGAAGGSFLQAELVSVERLSGAATSFSFWGPTSSLPVANPLAPTAEWTFGAGAFGTASGQTIFDLTALNTRVGDGTTTLFPGAAGTALPVFPNAFTPEQQAAGFGWNVNPGASLTTAVDPYGHLHGRTWSTNAPGDFRLVWRFFDANGLHGDSELLGLRLSAVPEPAAAALVVASAALALVLVRQRRFVSKNQVQS